MPSIPGLPLIRLHPFQGPQAVLPPADLFHHLLWDSRAFARAFRRERFGPFPPSLRSFTPPLVGEGQHHLELVLLPLVAHRVPPTTRRSLPFGPSPLARL